MRVAFGLVGLLVFVGAIVWIMGKSELPHDQEVLKQSENLKKDINQMAGNSRDGQMKFSDSVVLERQMKNGQTDSVLVTKIVAGGPAETFFGLKEGDAIKEIGPLTVQQQISSDDDARVFVMDAYQHQSQLTVIREGQRIKLPQAGAKPAAPVAPSANPLQNQLDAIKNNAQSR